LTTFSAQNISVAVVPVARERMWAVLRDAKLLAELTPLVSAIDAAGEVWTWHLRGVSALGVSVAPSFTELMTFDEPAELRFAHRPPDGRSERAGANGTYALEDLGDERTRLSIDITLCIELPLPKLSRRAVEGTISKMMQRTGERFATNLYEHLGIDSSSVETSMTAVRR